MMPTSSIKPRKPNPPKVNQKVDEKQSKDIMNSLFEDLDQQDADALEANFAQQANVPVAMNKEEEIAMKYAVTAPTKMVEVAENPFSKKRTIGEISKLVPDPVVE
jgi:hypothetical protein